MPAALLDSLAFSFPEIEVADSLIALSSRKGHFVLVANREFSRHVVFGQQGGGPGDLRGPAEMRRVPGGFAVLESGNGRVSAWSPTGAPLWRVTTGGATGGFAVDGRRHVFTVTSDGQAYLRESWGRDSTRTLGRRPSSSPEAWLDLVTRAPDDTYWIFDNAARAIVVMDATGRLLRTLRLPPSVEAEVSRAAEATDRQFRSQGLGGATAVLRVFRFVDDGRLLIRTTGEGPFALLVHPESRACVSLTLPSEPGARTLVREASTMTVADRTLFVVSDEGQVREFPLPDAAWNGPDVPASTAVPTPGPRHAGSTPP